MIYSCHICTIIMSVTGNNGHKEVAKVSAAGLLNGQCLLGIPWKCNVSWNFTIFIKLLSPMPMVSLRYPIDHKLSDILP